MDRFEWIATAAFGLEGVVARELARLGLDAKAENGGARFFGTFEDAFRANLHARCADRILLVMGRFEARSFEELFEGVRTLPLEDFIGERTRFPVNGKCARSQLMSVRDCQSITKKRLSNACAAAIARIGLWRMRKPSPSTSRCTATSPSSRSMPAARRSTAAVTARGTAKRRCAKPSPPRWSRSALGGPACPCTTPCAAQAR
ncbi:MAG: THUMP domain-containing protein [Christensenellales bacterium]